ncbi:DUF2268 domain-containing putative Zn-dependent protease [Winogradskyella sp.]|uniref:gliding motility protein GldB-related protein n=1 Tax=Winogradskyella sp. TaxID=1883156 RepID=UPI003BAB8731
MKHLILFLIVFSTNVLIYAQSFPSDPNACELITSDIDNFWKAFNLMENGYEGNPFDAYYMKIGSQGVIDFTPYRIEHADTLYHNVKRHKQKYLDVKASTFRVKEKKKQIRAAFYALKYIFPEAKFPPVYFVIGNFNSGGTSTPNGLIIGAETQNNIDNVPYIVAHELIHFQQKRYHQNPSLLDQSINEGIADFLGEMISGSHINTVAYKYGESNKDKLCKEFVKIMDSNNWDDWLYGTSGKDDRPNDLGYWMGYQIGKSYYEKQPDKTTAIKAMLDIKDANEFLEKSGYLDDYLD